MSTRMSFFWNLAAEQRLGGRKWNLFLDCETLRKMTADRCITIGGRWCCLRTWTELEGDAHQPLVICLLHRKTAERGPEVVRRVDKKLCPSFSLPHIFYLISALLLENSCLFDKGFHSGRVIGAHVGSHGTGWSAHCSRKVRRFSCFIFLPGSRMTWPTVNLDSWNPQTSTLFFLCVLCSFALLWSFYWVEELYQSCLPAGEINKNPTELIPACWCIPPWDPSPAYLPHSLFSFILFLSG